MWSLPFWLTVVVRRSDCHRLLPSVPLQKPKGLQRNLLARSVGSFLSSRVPPEQVEARSELHRLGEVSFIDWVGRRGGRGGLARVSRRVRWAGTFNLSPLLHSLRVTSTASWFDAWLRLAIGDGSAIQNNEITPVSSLVECQVLAMKMIHYISSTTRIAE